MLVEQALSWLGHVQNTAHRCSHDKDFTNEMDHLFQTFYRNFAEMHHACVETGVKISQMIGMSESEKLMYVTQVLRRLSAASLCALACSACLV